MAAQRSVKVTGEGSNPSGSIPSSEGLPLRDQVEGSQGRVRASLE